MATGGEEAMGTAGVECRKIHPAMHHRREGFSALLRDLGGGESRGKAVVGQGWGERETMTDHSEGAQK